MKKHIRFLKNNVVQFMVIVSLAVFLISGLLNPVSAKSLAVGAVLPISGPISLVGMAWQRGYEFYFDKVNEQGGLQIGNEQYLIDFYVEDSKMSYEGSRTAAMKLVHQQGAKFVFGAIIDVATEGIYEVTSSAGALNLITWTCVPLHPADVSSEKPLCIRPSITADDSQRVVLDYLREAYPDAKNIVIAAPNLNYEPMIEKIKPLAQERGLNISGVAQWIFGSNDFIPFLTKLLASKPDVIYSMAAAQSPHLLKQARQLGFNGPLISDAPTGPEIFLAVAGPNTTDVIACGMDMNSPSDVMREVMQRWEAKYNEPFVSDSFMGWDAAWILVQAMEKAQSIDPQEIVKAFDDMNEEGSLQTSFGPSYMGGKERYGVNRVLRRPIPVSHIMNGKVNFKGFFLP